MKILGKTWFAPMGVPACIGVVMAELTPQEQQEFGVDKPIQAWIGLAQQTKAYVKEEDDIEHIVKTGARFPVEAARVLLGVS